MFQQTLRYSPVVVVEASFESMQLEEEAVAAFVDCYELLLISVSAVGERLTGVLRSAADQGA